MNNEVPKLPWYQFTLGRWVFWVVAIEILLGWLRLEKASTWEHRGHGVGGITLQPRVWPAAIQINRQRFTSSSSAYYLAIVVDR